VGISESVSVGINICEWKRNSRTCNVANVTIVEKLYWALIDSGAVLSLVKPLVAQGFIPLQNSGINLVDIQGNTIPILGSMCLRVGIGPRRIVEHEFKVLESESFQIDLILGLDFLHKHGAAIDWGKGEMVLLGEKLPLYEENLGGLYGTLNGQQVHNQTHSHSAISSTHRCYEQRGMWTFKRLVVVWKQWKNQTQKSMDVLRANLCVPLMRILKWIQELPKWEAPKSGEKFLMRDYVEN